MAWKTPVAAHASGMSAMIDEHVDDVGEAADVRRRRSSAVDQPRPAGPRRPRRARRAGAAAATCAGRRAAARAEHEHGQHRDAAGQQRDALAWRREEPCPQQQRDRGGQREHRPRRAGRRPGRPCAAMLTTRGASSRPVSSSSAPATAAKTSDARAASAGRRGSPRRGSGSTGHRQPAEPGWRAADSRAAADRDRQRDRGGAAPDMPARHSTAPSSRRRRRRAGHEDAGTCAAPR